MSPALRIRLNPTTPWRTGSLSGDREQAEPCFHSDSLFGAVCSAFATLGSLEEWLAATAASGSPEVCFTSCFPAVGDLLFLPPPRSLWPPPGAPGKTRWASARFVPLPVAAGLLRGEAPLEDRWIVDGQSGCLLPVDRRGHAMGPFRFVSCAQAAVDRSTGGIALPHRAAALQFAPRAGLWCAAIFANDDARQRWSAPLMAAFRWLADSGFGGMRSRGFGRASAPEFAAGDWPSLLGLPAAETPARSWWLLSLMTPAEQEPVDWSRGSYEAVPRGGRVESADGWGEAKRQTSMLREGSVLECSAMPRGRAENVAPPGFAHPVWRAGFAAAVALPAKPAPVLPSATPHAGAAPEPASPPDPEEGGAAG